VADHVLDPLGLSIGDVSSVKTAAEEQKVRPATFGSMVRLFDGRIGAFAYLLLVLLYIPCVAAIYRETNLRWTLFACTWNAGLAYVAATLFYRIATIGRHAVGSLTWIVFLGALFAGVVLTMRYLGRKERRMAPTILSDART
jgi:ferrous iron transport protein B